jgi:hypothetical protein
MATITQGSGSAHPNFKCAINHVAGENLPEFGASVSAATLKQRSFLAIQE